jgi:protein TonB
MPRDLFGDVVESTVKVGTRQWYTVQLSMMSHLLVIGILVSAPLMATRVLPAPESIVIFVARPAVPPPPERRWAVDPPRVVDRPAIQTEVPAVAGPPAGPERPAPGGFSLPGLPASEGPSAFPAVTGAAVPLSQVPAAEPSVQRTPLPIGGAVKAPTKIRDVLPVYPAIARAAKAQGTVILEAVITKEGKVADVRVARSIAMLDAAAIDAVRQWQYTVPTLNGQPVDVTMIVTVHFELR